MNKYRLRIKEGYLSIMGVDESYSAVQIWCGRRIIWQNDIVQQDSAPIMSELEMLIEAIGSAEDDQRI